MTTVQLCKEIRPDFNLIQTSEVVRGPTAESLPDSERPRTSQNQATQTRIGLNLSHATKIHEVHAKRYLNGVNESRLKLNSIFVHTVTA